MGSMSRLAWAKRAAAFSLLPISALSLSGCGPETGETVSEGLRGESFNERFTQSFYDELSLYFGEDVTLTAQVEEILGPQAFTITGTDDAAADPLLVVHSEELPPLEPQTPIVVGGSVRENFDVAAVEEELGEELDDSLFEGWQNKPFLLADRAETA